MRMIRQFVLVALAVSAAVAQKHSKDPDFSEDPLTADQIAIYRTVLQDYVKDEDRGLNVADTTQSIDEPIFEQGCLQSAGVELPPGAGHVVRRLDPAVLPGPKMRLVDPGAQLEKVKKNDPEYANPKHKKRTEAEMRDTVEQAFGTGLFMLSEIVFDKDHQHAVLMYAFYCGMLCGNGSTVVLEKVDGAWKISKNCEKWIS